MIIMAEKFVSKIDANTMKIEWSEPRVYDAKKDNYEMEKLQLEKRLAEINKILDDFKAAP